MQQALPRQRALSARRRDGARLRHHLLSHQWRPAQPDPCATARSVATSDGGTERRPALQVSAHQSGSLITTESSRRWPAGLWPAEIGAPRRSRTYNPLAGSRVISRPVRAASLLVSGGARRFRSCPAIGQCCVELQHKRRPKRQIDHGTAGCGCRCCCWPGREAGTGPAAARRLLRPRSAVRPRRGTVGPGGNR